MSRTSMSHNSANKNSTHSPMICRETGGGKCHNEHAPVATLSAFSTVQLPFRHLYSHLKQFLGKLCFVHDHFRKKTPNLNLRQVFLGGFPNNYKLTWNPKMEVWKMIFLFTQVIFRVHVNFQASTYYFSDSCAFLSKIQVCCWTKFTQIDQPLVALATGLTTFLILHLS